ncbi:dipeptidase E [Pseudobacteriovorax antillogorgiicola]|uniref:Dipeptidase E n=2 Tax=Pseudobacteriovorax antillogorgiicola TaxID=1513793 RepID=A0A1Y6CLY9_9BACT|nr:dipeptidase E [Pseudobacteriovorax antillogorgiicola]SMF76561.1 dipeptidase E [Pseudobacteriovorax antillogorgiicola]
MFSSGEAEDNEDMDEDLFHEIDRKRPQITFIPAHQDDALICYDEFIERFAHYDYIKFRMLDLESPVTQKELRKTLQSDLIYLSGGNTFHFLKYLRSSGFINELRYYAKSGGLIAGHSAGAILMTPHIRTASFPYFDRDENEVGIKNFIAMRLVKFEFFPHYVNNIRYSDALVMASKKCHWPIYAAADGGGVAITDKGLRVYGKVWAFFQGKKFKIGFR